MKNCYSGNTEFDPRNVLCALLFFMVIGLPALFLLLICMIWLAQTLGAILFWVGIKVWATLEYWIRNKL
jgi:uncharacterized paraquat-inducible protein A